MSSSVRFLFTQQRFPPQISQGSRCSGHTPRVGTARKLHSCLHTQAWSAWSWAWPEPPPPQELGGGVVGGRVIGGARGWGARDRGARGMGQHSVPGRAAPVGIAGPAASGGVQIPGRACPPPRPGPAPTCQPAFDPGALEGPTDLPGPHARSLDPSVPGDQRASLGLGAVPAWKGPDTCGSIAHGH